MRLFCFISFFTTSAFSVDFVRDVRPIFEKNCYECHGAEKQKNDYRLDIKTVALTGGQDHAPNIIAGKSAESPLFRFVSGVDEKFSMPPKTKLSSAEIDLLKRWIDEGAVWPEGVDIAQVEDRLDWWSFKPLQAQLGAMNIDSYIHAKLAEKGMKPASQADTRTLIRRLYFDLTGLPPTPEEITKYSALPYEKLVDDLLASPRYGERWARHWLDLVHYGETHGYDKDKPRMNAWPYRDYVIRALNSDKPYTRFIEEQIAGDVLYPGTTDGITALGFISAGPWDLIGHAEVPETKLDGKIARHLDRDDMVQNTIGTFCSLTVQCAQCHYHKFDPISQEDYYSLQAVFAGVDQDGQPVSLNDYAGKKLVLYFYPKDDTPGCTAEACSLRDNYDKLLSAGYDVLGVSTDPVKSHKKFVDKFTLPFRLLSDTEKTVSEAFGVYGLKKFMGKEYMGINRTTFLIDEKGIISDVISKVDTKKHAEQIL